jgi:uncharacterized membrane protein
MTNLLAAMAYFIAIHLLVSGTRVRDHLVARIGQGPYMGLFVILSWIGLIWVGWAYAGVRHEAENRFFWGPTPATRHIQLGVQLLAMLLIVPGLTTRNPTAVRSEGALERPDVVRGMVRITRHPFLWGVAVWAAGHLMVNGDLASFVLFGGLLFVALVGTVSIDAKRRRALGLAWAGFEAQTSNIPFAAILRGRQRLSLPEVGPGRILAAIAVWAILAVVHPFLFGVRALP